MTIQIGESIFKVDRGLLIATSRFFEIMFRSELKEGTGSEVRLEETNPYSFLLLLQLIQGHDVQFERLDDLFDVLLLVQKFQVESIDLLAVIRSVRIPSSWFDQYVSYLDLLFPAGFSPEVIDLIAAQLKSDLDPGQHPELEPQLRATQYYRNYGSGVIRDLVLKMEEMAEASMDQPLKYCAGETVSGP